MKRKFVRQTFPSLLVALLFCAATEAKNNPHAENTFWLILNGSNEVPPNGSIVTGHGSFVLDGDWLNFAFGGFTPQDIVPIDAGIYGPAREGKNGRTVFDHLGYGIAVPEGIVYTGSFQLTPDQIAQLRAGLWYVNIKTVQFPNGELRGQILPVTP